MGIYINPPDQEKEEWLADNAIAELPLKNAELDADYKVTFPVCLVDNGPFTAAGVADTPTELGAFTGVSDVRPKRFFIVHVDKLTDKIIGERYAAHLRSLAG